MMRKSMDKGILGMGFAAIAVMSRILLISLSVFLIAGISFAEVYKWVDDNGVVYFTDNMIQIPEKYRSKAERLELPEEKKDQQVEEESTPKKKVESYRDQLGRGEEYWKARVDEWRKKLTESQTRLQGLRTRYNELTERFNDSKSTAERATLRRERDQVKNEMDQLKIQIDEATNMIAKKIPEEAEIYKAKPEWLK
jgi:chromosome segregation ATPase